MLCTMRLVFLSTPWLQNLRPDAVCNVLYQMDNPCHPCFTTDSSDAMTTRFPG